MGDKPDRLYIVETEIPVAGLVCISTLCTFMLHVKCVSNVIGKETVTQRVMLPQSITVIKKESNEGNMTCAMFHEMCHVPR